MEAAGATGAGAATPGPAAGSWGSWALLPAQAAALPPTALALLVKGTPRVAAALEICSSRGLTPSTSRPPCRRLQSGRVAGVLMSESRVQPP
jgi:hypothetical protein